jgi:septal ring-binding cell division protein DamX
MLPNMRQLKERITHSFNLLPLPARDIKDYLNFRLRAAGYKGPDLFSPDALKLIAEASEGLTRRINIYADKTLLAAYADNTHTITPDHVRAAISDTQIVLPGAKSDRSRWLTATVFLIVGSVIGFMAGRMTATVSAVAPSPISTQAAAPTTARITATPIAGTISAESTTVVAVPAAPVSPDPAVAPNAEPRESAPNTATAAVSDVNVTAGNADVTKVPPATPRQQETQNKAVVILPAAGKPALFETEKTSSIDWLYARMEADISRLGGMPANRHSIQLMTADPREKSAIESFLRIASQELNSDRIMVYPAGTSENPRVSVLYGNFAERTVATEEMLKLSAKLAKFKPYVRSIGAIREDLRPRADLVAGNK